MNFLATWRAWRDDPFPLRCRTLHFVSLEKHPFATADLAIAHAAWPEFAELSALLRERWPPLVAGEHRIALDGGNVGLRLVFGDAVETLDTLSGLDGAVDAFYLDGFSPAKNPDLWSPPVCAHLARLSAPEATLSTWSVAGSVRQTLTAAGFLVEKRPGFAGKRQMLLGRYSGLA